MTMSTVGGNPDEEVSREDSVHGPRVSGFVVLPRKHRAYFYSLPSFPARVANRSIECGYPRTIQDLGLGISVHNLITLVSRFLFQQMNPDVPLPEDDISLPPLPEVASLARPLLSSRSSVLHVYCLELLYHTVCVS